MPIADCCSSYKMIVSRIRVSCRNGYKGQGTCGDEDSLGVRMHEVLQFAIKDVMTVRMLLVFIASFP